MNICLASGSPRRLELLQSLGHHVRVIKPDICEINTSDKSNLTSVARNNARLKARHVFEHGGLLDADFILAADTIVIFKNEIFTKARDFEHAQAMLTKLSGQTHSVITAFCLINSNQEREAQVISQVKFRILKAQEIKAYVALGESFDKAGAYGVQGAGAALVDSIEGSVTNVIGLPVGEVLHEAKLLLSGHQS